MDEKTTKILDVFFPHGAKREIWWVTQESLKNTCNACGRCCAMIGFAYSIDQMRRIFIEAEGGSNDPDIHFIVENMATIPEKEAVARGGDGGGAQFVVCARLTEEGLCSIHDDKPAFCRRHPVLGQSVLKECAFAGIDNFERSPRGLKMEHLRNMPAVKLDYKALGTVDRELVDEEESRPQLSRDSVEEFSEEDV